MKILESDISLEESLKIYEESKKILESANELLDEASGKVKKIIEKTDEGYEVEDFKEKK